METKNYTTNFLQSDDYKKNFRKIILLLLVLTMFINAARAQNTKRKDAPSLNFGIEAALPTGDLSLITSFGGGGSLKLIVPLDNTVSFIISAGFIHYFSKTLFGEKFGGFNSFPFKGGFRFSAKPGFYFEPQAGYSIFISEGESDGAFTYGANIGYMLHKKADFSFGYESATKNGGSISHIGLRIAYNFSLTKKSSVKR